MEYFCNKTPLRHGLTGAKIGKVAEIRGFTSQCGGGRGEIIGGQWFLPIWLLSRSWNVQQSVSATAGAYAQKLATWWYERRQNRWCSLHCLRGPYIQLRGCRNYPLRLLELAIEEAYRRDPNGYYDEDAISGDEIPMALWYSPIAVFVAINGTSAAACYWILRSSRVPGRLPNPN